MAEVGIDISHHHSKLWMGLMRDHWDWVITVCDSANERCPKFFGNVRRVHWSLPDPSEAGGDDETKLAAFRKSRDEIIDRVHAWRAEEVRGPATGAAPRDSA